MAREFMPRPVWLILVVLIGSPGRAWDTLPHQRITRSALDTLPRQVLDRLSGEVEPLIHIYCIYPDLYEEMERYGFVRKGAGPQRASAIRAYCVGPEGQHIHGAGGDREMDGRSLTYLLGRIVETLSEGRSAEAARYAGVLSHFIADSLSPPHAVGSEELLEMADLPAPPGRINIHSALERSIPEFALTGRSPRVLGRDIPATAKKILDRCYEGAGQNRRDLAAMVKAASARDEAALDEYRLRAARSAAEILSDGLYTVLTMGQTVR